MRKKEMTEKEKRLKSIKKTIRKHRRAIELLKEYDIS